MADHTANLRKLCFHFPKKSPDYLLEMLTKHNGDYETTAAAIRKDGNICIKFFRNLVDRFRKCTNNAKARTDFQIDERNEVFEINIGHDLAKTLREKFENATSLSVPEGFEPVISMPASLGKKLYLLYAESVFHQEEMQKLEDEVRFARADEELARRVQEVENAAELEEMRKKKNYVITSQSRRPKRRDEDLGDKISLAPGVPKPIIKPVPKRSVFETNRTSEERDDPDLISFGIWNNQPSTETSRQTTFPVDSTDSCEKARAMLANYKFRSQEMRDNIDSQQLFVPSPHLSTVKSTLTLPREIIYLSPQSDTQDESGPGTKIKSKLQQFVNPISLLSLDEFESETVEKNNSNSQELQSASHYRDKAQKHLKNKQKYEDMAKCLLQDDRGLSQHYFQLSEQEARQYDECNQLAALIFLGENLEKSTRSNIIDLHHLYVKEALQCLDIFLDQEICLLQIEAKASKKLSIITGRGKHSLHGIARIKPEVTRRLAERGLKFEEKNPGLLKATVRKDSCMTTDLARSCTEVD